MTMNTREREVTSADLARNLRALHDALRKAWDDGVLPASVIPAELARETTRNLAAYDALLAEGSASSEGAEAVGHLNVRRFRGMVNHDFEYTGNLPDGCYALYTHPQPAQGEQCSALARLRAIHSAIDRASGDTDPAADSTDDELRDSSPLTWAAMKLAQFIDELESALPRGLPAGSDAKPLGFIGAVQLQAYIAANDQKEFTTVWKSKQYDDDVAVYLATAEQPSCGQDAREWSPTNDDMPEEIMAAKRVNVVKSDAITSWWVGHGKDESCQIEGTPNHWYWLAYILLGLVDAKDAPYSEDKPLPFSPAYVRAAIAAQQRRGGGWNHSGDAYMNKYDDGGHP